LTTDATPRQQLWFGLLMLVVALWLGYTVWSGMPGWSVPPLIAYVVAGCFAAAGVALLLQRAGYARAGTFTIFLLALGMAAIGGWIGFGPGERRCTANDVAMGESTCRVVFGGGAIVTAGIAVLIWRMLVRRRLSA